MSSKIKAVFAEKAKEGKPAFIPFVTAGHPALNSTVPVLLALEQGGADIIELGVPHTDPVAEGPTIQESTNVALENGVTPAKCLEYVKEARAAGLKVPVVLMGYYNPLLAYGEQKMVQDAQAAGADGFIVVDFPPEESANFRSLCAKSDLSYVPLVAPTTSDERLEYVNSIADSFVYCVSLLGVTGGRTELSKELPEFLSRVRTYISHPLAVGFGISTRAQFDHVAQLGASAVVVGSTVVKSLAAAHAKKEDVAAEAKKLALSFTHNRTGFTPQSTPAASPAPSPATALARKGKLKLPSMFGSFGGRYAPETLMHALEDLEHSYALIKDDPAFKKELEGFNSFIGRPTPVYYAERLSKLAGGAQIWFKREDLAHTGAHKINNAVGQALLAKRLGKARIIAETGAGQHGVATATVCAKLGLECVVCIKPITYDNFSHTAYRQYMGSEDIERQSLNVFRMKTLGATVVPVTSGSKTLKDAINEAMRDWVTNIRTTHYLVGSAIGPHPFPTIVRDFQSVIGREARAQFQEQLGALPDVVMACVGGGSNSIGMFHPFVNDKSVRIVGVEAAGSGLHTTEHCATLVKGTVGVLHGTRTLLLQDPHGQIAGTHSISAGLDYPGVGPEHAWLKESGRAEYVGVDDKQALEGFKLLAGNEGILPALETSHAVYHAVQLAKQLPASQRILVCLSGRGDKDMNTIIKHLSITK